MSDDRRKYQADHARVYRSRGRASALPCVKCWKPASHWAHIHDTDPSNPENYDAMCVPCHRLYDDPDRAKARAAQASRVNTSISPDHRAKISEAHRGREMTPEWRAKLSDSARRAHAEGRGRWSRRG